MRRMSKNIPLGRSVPYPEQYSPELLFRVSREEQRKRLEPGGNLPFHGTDIWNAWELTWLDHGGQPKCATAEIRVPADSPNIVESKSLKLYFNSLAMTHYASENDVAETIEQDLSDCIGAEVDVILKNLAESEGARVARFPGHSLDSARVRCDRFEPDAALLRADPDDLVTEDLYSICCEACVPSPASRTRAAYLSRIQARASTARACCAISCPTGNTKTFTKAASSRCSSTFWRNVSLTG